MDPNAQLEDIFWGIYHWLDGHPTETILVSVKVDNGNNTAELQQKVYNLITGDTEGLLGPKHSRMQPPENILSSHELTI